jgi:hypothetical protein
VDPRASESRCATTICAIARRASRAVPASLLSRASCRQRTPRMRRYTHASGAVPRRTDVLANPDCTALQLQLRASRRRYSKFDPHPRRLSGMCPAPGRRSALPTVRPPVAPPLLRSERLNQAQGREIASPCTTSTHIKVTSSHEVFAIHDCALRDRGACFSRLRSLVRSTSSARPAPPWTRRTRLPAPKPRRTAFPHRYTMAAGEGAEETRGRQMREGRQTQCTPRSSDRSTELCLGVFAKRTQLRGTKVPGRSVSARVPEDEEEKGRQG